MSECDLAEAAHHAAESLNIDLSDPGCFNHAEETMRAAESGLFETRFDARALRRFLTALATAANDRGVPPSQLWNALDALERN